MSFQKTATITEGGYLTNESRAAFGSASSPEWCRRLLEDASLVPLPTDWREMTPDKICSMTDSLFAYTFRTPETFRAWHSMYRPPSTDPGSPATGAGADGDDTASLDGEVLCLVSLGDGLNGHGGVAHGGAVAALVDVVMCTAASLHTRDRALTVQLTTQYKRPVATPGLYLARGWLKKRSGGRKAWFRVVLEDGDGRVYVEAEAFWLAMGPGAKI